MTDETPRRRFLATLMTSVAGAVTAGGLSGCTSTAEQAADENRNAALRPTELSLVRYAEGKSIALDFSEPRGLHIAPDGRVWLAGDRSLISMAPDGSDLKLLRLDASVQCCAVAPGGEIFVALDDHVEVLDSHGARISAWAAPGPRAILTAIAVAANGVWVADSGGREVLRCDTRGAVQLRFGRKTPDGYPGLIVPSPHLDLALHGSDTIWVTNPGMHRVENHAVDGSLRSAWGDSTSDTAGFCGCCNPTDIALLPDGRFITAEKGIPRVKRYTADGQFDGIVAGPERFASKTMGIDLACLPSGEVLVLDSVARTLRRFTPTEGAHA